jgi:prepilin-type N-terminal cleavage/methylation domain-containing protein/prepilin-type processing-associated H-X9-DG protein
VKPAFVSPSGAGGFSLIELLVVLAIIVVLSTMFFGFGSPDYQKVEKKNCQGNLQKIFLALEIYANDNRGVFPIAANASTSERPLELLVPRYSADTSLFICPGSEDKPTPSGEPLSKYKISYAYYMGVHFGGAQAALMSDAQVNTNSKTVGDQIFSTTGKPPGNNHHKFGGNVMFSDGHVELSKAKLEFPLPVNQGVELLNPK